jgi:midasin
MRFFGFYLQLGPQKPKTQEECEFLVTQTFERHIVDLLRAISNCDLPVLIEGPTSSGKTSVIKFLAELTGY